MNSVGQHLFSGASFAFNRYGDIAQAGSFVSLLQERDGHFRAGDESANPQRRAATRDPINRKPSEPNQWLLIAFPAVYQLFDLVELNYCGSRNPPESALPASSLYQLFT
jgi:hypothetical protein